ncbi:hypothetical protein [Leptolyngbya sp. FACHB-261]|uniref:hypothetical protein n=1 Tax=Leptolyngbya sp. FACHB-261 TaxID=2692806 RepID=UPI001682AE68|nr:hypothetical protein [Leptolyngbya sp. FACHB-261]MBD2103794.1 hypothetical protein [Leptolyngbya sp. FACHB-261]
MKDWVIVGTAAQHQAVEAFAQVLQVAGQSVQICWEPTVVDGQVCEFTHPVTIGKVAGDLWLPVVWTAKGPLYAEVIGRAGDAYRQPIHLKDEQRQVLYALARHCLLELAAKSPSSGKTPRVTPGVYLVQFSLSGTEVQLGQIWPFPAEPALASIGVQSLDLFTCHWYCLTGLPILDLTIDPRVTSL